MKQLTLLEQLDFIELIEDKVSVSHVDADINKCFEINYKEFYADVREALKRDAKRDDKADKALRLLAEWADDFGFVYDYIPEQYEKYKDDIKGMSCAEGLIYIVKKEVESGVSE